MNRTSLPPLLADLDECIRNLRDAGCNVRELERARMALGPPPERESFPPNAPARRTANEHFRKAREYTSEALRRLRRDQ